MHFKPTLRAVFIVIEPVLSVSATKKDPPLQLLSSHMIMREVGGLGPGLGLHGALPASVSAFASSSPALFSSTRGGRPAIAITARRRGRSGAFLSASVVAAEAQQGAGPGVPRVGPPPQQAVGKELSESDARVLRELMNDADFMESLRERNVRISPDVLDSVDRAAPAAPTYSSQTLKAAADLSLSWGGFVAKLSDALESAAIYVSNKVRGGELVRSPTYLVLRI